jgi:hypothetical protein
MRTPKLLILAVVMAVLAISAGAASAVGPDNGFDSYG